jgi:hypothetical protein
MRRSIIIVLVLLALITNVGCSDGTNVTPKGDTPAVTTPVEEKPDLVISDNIKVEFFKDYSNIKIVTVTVTNQSKSAIGGIEINLYLCDLEGKFVGKGIYSLPEGTTLMAGGVWQYSYWYTNQNAPDVTQVLAWLTVK